MGVTTLAWQGQCLGLEVTLRTLEGYTVEVKGLGPRVSGLVSSWRTPDHIGDNTHNQSPSIDMHHPW